MACGVGDDSCILVPCLFWVRRVQKGRRETQLDMDLTLCMYSMAPGTEVCMGGWMQGARSLNTSYVMKL